MRLEIHDAELRARLERVIQCLGETDLSVRAYPHPNSFPPTSGHVAGLITHPSGIAQAVAEEVDELLYIEMSDEDLGRRLQRLANANQDDASSDLEALQHLTRAMATGGTRRSSSTVSRRSQSASSLQASILLFSLDEDRAQVITATDRGDDSGEPLYLHVKIPRADAPDRGAQHGGHQRHLDHPLMHTVRDDVTSAGVGAAVLFPLLFEGDLIGCVFLRRHRRSRPRTERCLRDRRRRLRRRPAYGSSSKDGAPSTGRGDTPVLAEGKLEDYERFEEFFAYASDGMAVLDAKVDSSPSTPKAEILSYMKTSCASALSLRWSQPRIKR